MVEEAIDAGARLNKACTVIGISTRTYQRWIDSYGNVKEDQRPYADRPIPVNKLTIEEYNSIVKVVNLPEYANLAPSQIVPTLADKGIYLASESTIYRILRNEKMLKHRGKSKKPSKTKMPETHIATRPNQVWSWDITYLNNSIRGMYYKLYMIIDIFSRKIVGWEIWEEEKGEYAAELMDRTVFLEKVKFNPPILHSDNGSPMKSFTLKAKLESLGIISSYSRPRVSNDNPYSEALFRTCKYHLSYPTEGFKNIETARKWVHSFVNWYNNEHYHSGLNFIKPITRHNGTANEIVEKRIKLYESAREIHPERWAKQIRNWKIPESVALNPVNKKLTS